MTSEVINEVKRTGKYYSGELDRVSSEISELSDEMLALDINANNAKGLIYRITDLENQLSTIRLKLSHLHNVLHSMIADRTLDAGQQQDSILLMEDLDIDKDTVDYLFNRINFMMNAVTDFINIKQNKIIQVFSVASVALLPPTLVASIYGMNIQIPELIWLGSWSYPWAVILMILSAVIPMWVFWKKGWLK